MVSTTAVWQQAAQTPTNHRHLAAQQKPNKNLSLNKKNTGVFRREKKNQENGPLVYKWQDRKSNKKTLRKNWRGDRKRESHDSPEIPDRRRTSYIPDLPLGDNLTSHSKKTHCRPALFKKKKKNVYWNVQHRSLKHAVRENSSATTIMQSITS